MREALSILLEEEGFTTLTAENGARALQLLRGGERPHLILLDQMMPVMTGKEFRRQQSKDPALASIPVVIFTGSDYDRKASFTGVAGYVRKPIDFDKLLGTIRQVCGFANPVRRPVPEDAIMPQGL